MSLFFHSLFSGTISTAGGCILEFAFHHGSAVVPLLLEGPFLPLPVCKGCVYASPFFSLLTFVCGMSDLGCLKWLMSLLGDRGKVLVC